MDEPVNCRFAQAKIRGGVRKFERTYTWRVLGFCFHFWSNLLARFSSFNRVTQNQKK